MNIGIVTTWFERGAAYVSKTYLKALTSLGHKVFIYSRGGDGKPDKNNTSWNEGFVTVDRKYNDTKINKHKFYKWINKNKLDLVFFNEQRDFFIVAKARLKYPNLLLGSYIDYYKEDTLKFFNIYDFVICNTKRHLEAMNFHKQKFYLKWCVDSELYKSDSNKQSGETIFFHSAGMSNRKGTDILINAFIDGKLYEKSKLIIHTQKSLKSLLEIDESEFSKFNIEVINKTVSAPGLYGLGNVYVYPTKLDGLGLTMYEAMSFGMPVIATNYPPMNEIVNDNVGSLIDVSDHYCRADAYYYPMSVCDKESLIRAMKEYIVNKELILKKGDNARKFIINECSFERFVRELDKILNQIKLQDVNVGLCKECMKKFCNPFHKYLVEVSEGNNFLKRIKYFLKK